MLDTLLPFTACIGGGTGLSTMLRGLKRFTPNISAIVAVSDDGGGSGVLRRELGMLPPGDIRNCIQALSEDERLMTQMLNYRFSEGSLAGQSFGNLLLAALNGMSDTFDEAVNKACDVLAITGRVMPVTNDNVILTAELADGTVVSGESHIEQIKTERKCRIKSVSLVPGNSSPLSASIEAIEDADMIILGPGSLYTSVIPNLLVDGVAEAIARTRAVKVYVCNIMTQPGETEGYSVADHINALFSHAGQSICDYCIVNSAPLSSALIRKYALQGAEPIYTSSNSLCGVKIIKADVALDSDELARHDPIKLGRELMKLYRAQWARR
ncbi:MAG: YvcK family protein [Oscillospiraceae bacterium]|nr:YvcK family protein [Oscillospiraceae bacterium]